MKFITQAAKVLQEQKKSKRRLAVFLCLAALVALGTVTALRMYGQAMSHKEKRLICQAEAHQHTDDCYDGDKLVCGQADYLVHTHNDDCYGADGSLVCHLAEIAVHTHTDECYTEEEVLVCTEEEQAHQHTDDCYTPERGDLQCQTEEHAHDEGCFDSETGELVCQLEEHQHDDNCYVWNEVLTCTAGGHQHSADCYIKEQGGLQCQIEEHTHDDACYDENGALICQMEEHTHEDTCYAWEDVLICQLEEGPAGHIHTDACYEKRKVPTCGQLELHTHGGSCYDENGELICELLELKEHTHQEECFETVELTDEEVAVKLEQQEMEEDPENAPEDGTDSAAEDGAGTVSDDSVSSDEAGTVSGDSVSGDKISGNSVSGDKADIVSDNDADVHEHDETCYDAAGGLMCGYDEEPPITQTYTDEEKRYTVTAAYHKDANIPKDAELRAEMITAEGNEEYYAEREAEIRETLNDEDITMDALFKIGFYVDGEEVEPESDVTVTVRFLNENGLTDGTPMTIIHFGEEGNEILGGSHAKNRSTTFKTNRFSDFAAIFHNILTAVKAEPGQIDVDGTDDKMADETEEEGEATINSSDSENAVSDHKNVISPNTSSSNNLKNVYAVIRHQAEGTEEQTDEIEKEMAQPQRVIISGNYDYKGNGYDVTFHVEGRATVSENVSSDDIQETPVADANSPSEGTDVPDETIPGDETSDNELRTGNEGIEGDVSEGNDLALDSDEEGMDGTDGETSSGEESDSGAITEDPGMDDESASGTTDENFGTTGEQAETVIQDTTNEKLEFRIKGLGEGSKEHAAIMDHIETQGNTDDYLLLQILSYSMTYDGTALDLSDCKVTADISVDEEDLKKFKERSSDDDPENIEIKIKAAEVLEDSEVNELGMAVMNKGNARMTVVSDEDNLVMQVNETPDPKFTVQYYANLDRIKKEAVDPNYSFNGNNGELAVIDTTSGNGLPQNGVTPSLKKLTVQTQDVKDEKGNIIAKQGALVTETKLEEVYESKTYRYKEAPSLMYFNKLYENPNYVLKEIWILKEGKDKTSTMKTDWEIIEKDKVRFTNRPGQTAEPGDTRKIVTITDKTVLRLVYDPKKRDYTNDANFYDYDITNGDGVTATQIGAIGTEQTGDVRKRGQGINSPSNYVDGTAKPILAFGNGNTGTGLWTQTFEDNGVTNYINKRNRENTPGGRADVSYAGCTFKIVDHLGANGNIVYNKNICVPKLFNEGATEGKTLYKSTLGFRQSGDEYTLSTARALTDLEVFKHPQAKYPGIWTNNYWPMDDVPDADRKDPKTGGDVKSAKGYKQVPNPTEANAVGEYTDSQGYPPSDDGIAHNNMFGMHFAVDFELTEDYIGPLDYLFFGDDDMWVFLDRLNADGSVANDPTYNGKLVCDLGGIHSSVGEYVDLWDYIEKDQKKNTTKKGKYRLTFFYTERGLSGSTCFMQFTLPSVSKATPDQTTGNLQIKKEAFKMDGDKEEAFTQDEIEKMTFNFNIKLTANDSGLHDNYAYTIYRKNGTEDKDVIMWGEGNMSNDTDFSLKPGDYMIIKYLPVGMGYEIMEKDPDQGDYRTDIAIDGTSQTVDAAEERIASGTITQAGKEVVVKYKNKLHIYELPHTGGFGTMLYTIAGVTFVSLGAGFMYRRRFRKGGI